MQAYLGGGGGFGGESCFTTCVMPCPSSLPLLLRKIRESYRVEWQPPSQGSLLPVLGTRLNGVGVRATDRRSPSPRLSPRPLGLAPTPPRFGIQQKEFTETERRKYMQCRVNCIRIWGILWFYCPSAFTKTDVHPTSEKCIWPIARSLARTIPLKQLTVLLWSMVGGYFQSDIK